MSLSQTPQYISAAGNDAATATLIQNVVSYVTATANGQGVQLPQPWIPFVGGSNDVQEGTAPLQCSIINQGGLPFTVYPPNSNDTLLINTIKPGQGFTFTGQQVQWVSGQGLVTCWKVERAG